MIRVIGLALLGMLLFGCAQTNGARWTPLQLALYDPGQIAPDSWDVYGARMNLLYGRNRNVYGMDVGCWNRADGHAAGVQAGLVHYAASYIGLQTALIYASATGPLHGIQFGGLFGTYADEANGIQLAAFANESMVMRGLQVTLIGNEVHQDSRGVQISCLGLNWNSGRTAGLQIGLANIAKKLSGVQIGLININKEGLLPFFPIINFGLGSGQPSPKDPAKTETGGPGPETSM